MGTSSMLKISKNCTLNTYLKGCRHVCAYFIDLQVGVELGIHDMDSQETKTYHCFASGSKHMYVNIVNICRIWNWHEENARRSKAVHGYVFQRVHMCVCIVIHTCVYTKIYIYICVYVCIQIYIHTYIQIFIYIYIYIHIYLYIYIYIYIYMYIHIYIYIYIYVCVYIYIHIYVYIYIMYMYIYIYIYIYI